jgi:hypothetical protein
MGGLGLEIAGQRGFLIGSAVLVAVGVALIFLTPRIQTAQQAKTAAS